MENSHQNMQWKMQIGYMKGQGGSAISMDASTLMQLNDYFVNIWTTNTGFAWRWANMAILVFMLGDQGNKITKL